MQTQSMAAQSQTTAAKSQTTAAQSQTMATQPQTMATEPQTMAAQPQTMVAQPPANAHKEIPGNPSTAKSSQLRLNDRSNGEPLRLLTEEDWNFWINNGYVIIKNAVPKEQVKKLADYLWDYEGKDPDDMETWYRKPN